MIFNNVQSIFNIADEQGFIMKSREILAFQAEHNSIFRYWLTLNRFDFYGNDFFLDTIPFLPIEIFKNEKICIGEANKIFTSSGTTGTMVSKHFVHDVALYELSFRKGFQCFYGDINQYCFLALLPSYLERDGSSLIYMMQDFIHTTKLNESGFYLHEYDAIMEKVKRIGKKIILIGVSFALLDFAEKYAFDFSNCIIMETGGMKGRRAEITRAELHEILQTRFCVNTVHSEYGMTELLSQAYSTGNGKFRTPPWMKVIITDVYEPTKSLPTGQRGIINVIDLANVYSCSFIQTADVGMLHDDGTFSVIGRMDNSDIRGCNLMVI